MGCGGNSCALNCAATAAIWERGGRWLLRHSPWPSMAPGAPAAYEGSEVSEVSSAMWSPPCGSLITFCSYSWSHFLMSHLFSQKWRESVIYHRSITIISHLGNRISWSRSPTSIRRTYPERVTEVNIVGHGLKMVNINSHGKAATQVHLKKLAGPSTWANINRQWQWWWCSLK